MKPSTNSKQLTSKKRDYWKSFELKSGVLWDLIIRVIKVLRKIVAIDQRHCGVVSDSPPRNLIYLQDQVSPK